MFNANGEIELPRVIWFIIIGVTGGSVIIYGLTYVVALLLFYVAWLAILGFIFLLLTGIDDVVNNRRGVKR